MCTEIDEDREERKEEAITEVEVAEKDLEVWYRLVGHFRLRYPSRLRRIFIIIIKVEMELVCRLFHQDRRYYHR